MKFYYFVLLFVYGQIILAEKPLCNRKGKKVCCSGYRWNETIRICEECPPGYRGTDCKFMCYPPYYGARCRQTCQCPRDLCDAVSGCKTTSTTDKFGNKAQPSTIAYRKKGISDEVQNEETPALMTCIDFSCAFDITEKNLTFIFTENLLCVVGPERVRWNQHANVALRDKIKLTFYTDVFCTNQGSRYTLLNKSEDFINASTSSFPYLLSTSRGTKHTNR